MFRLDSSLFVALVACTTPADSAAGTTEEAPAVEGEITLVKADVLRNRLTAPGEKPRVYNFWATWCGPCVHELPTLKKFAAAHPEVEVVLVNVDVPSLRKSKVEPFIKKHDLKALQHWQIDDPDPARVLITAAPNWPDMIPVTYAVLPDGTIAHQFNGLLSEAELAEMLLPKK